MFTFTLKASTQSAEIIDLTHFWDPKRQRFEHFRKIACKSDRQNVVEIDFFTKWSFLASKLQGFRETSSFRIGFCRSVSLRGSGKLIHGESMENGHGTNVLSHTGPLRGIAQTLRFSYAFCRVPVPPPLHTSPPCWYLIPMKMRVGVRGWEVGELESLKVGSWKLRGWRV